LFIWIYLEFHRTKLLFFVKDITLHFVKFVRMFISIKNYVFSPETLRNVETALGVDVMA